MPRKRFTAEQIIGHIREAEILLSQGKTVAETARVSCQTQWDRFTSELMDTPMYNYSTEGMANGQEKGSRERGPC